jgi:alpha-glucosidase (family GH31 glycosyl hydrolase)
VTAARVESAEGAVELRREQLTDEVFRLTAADARAESLTLVFRCLPDDQFAGLGEQFVRVPQRGRVVTGWNFDGAGENTYFHAPVLYSSAGWTLVVDTGQRYRADIASSAADEVRFDIPGQEIVAYLLVAPAKRALELLTEMTGRPPVPPGWAFGVWHNVRSGSDAVLAQAQRLREARIPGSVLWVDDHYDAHLNHGDGHPGNYPLGAYPDLTELVDGIHALGFKAVTYLNPMLYKGTPAFDDAVRRGLAVERAGHEPLLIDFFNVLTVRGAGVRFDKEAAAILDLTNPDAVAWFREKLRAILVGQGWDGWMQDFGEQVLPDALLHGGKGADWHNLFALLYHAASAAEQAASKPDSLFFARAGYLGAQALAPCVWGGDQTATWDATHGLPSVLPGGLSAALLGVSTWGPDINGLAAPTFEEPGKPYRVANSTGDKELWIRWAQLGAWTPLMRTHLGFKPRPKRPLDLWYDRETEDAFRTLAETHIRLFPYFQSLAVEAARTGVPIMRPMLLEWPDDITCWNLSDQFMLGPALLVAPVMEPDARRRRVYLPAGQWFELGTTVGHDGPGWVEVDAPVDKVPVFQRAGTIVPVLSRAPQTLFDETLLSGTFDLELWVTAGGNGSFELFDGTRIALMDEVVRVSGPARRYSLLVCGMFAGVAEGEEVAHRVARALRAATIGPESYWREAWDQVAKSRGVESAGIVHAWNIEPDPPAPGEAAEISITSDGPRDGEVRYTVDGSDPGGAAAMVLPLEPAGDSRLAARIPGQPAGTRVRYQVGVHDGEVLRTLEDGGPELELPHPDVSFWRPPSPNFSYVSREVRPPDWAQDAVLYHVLVDRFARGDGRRVCRNEDIRPLDFHGGSLAGLTRRLDHIADLGANCIWLSPIYPGVMHVTYDVRDLFSVEPRFGTVDDVRRLVKEAHDHGIRLLLDFEVSYLGSSHPFVLDARANPASEYRDWFRWHRYPDQPYSFLGLPGFVTVDHDHPVARRHLFDAARFWLDLGFDGFRLDSAASASFDFWTEFGQVVREHNPEALTIAESITAPEHLRRFGGRLDGFLDFGFSEALRGALSGRLDAPALARGLSGSAVAFSPGVVRPAFLESHDVPRLSFLVGGDRRRLELGAALLLTAAETPVLYYGSEVGLSQVGLGELETTNRLPMRWEEEQDLEMLDVHRRLVALRNSHPELRRGQLTILEAGKSGLLAFERRLEGASVIVVANLSSRALRRKAPGWLEGAVPLMSSGGFAADQGLRLGPYGYAILRG